MSQATMLVNRVKKNMKHRAKWARRENVTCWRVYDRDIPELPLAIDTYEGALVINDYRHQDAEGNRGGGEAWLVEMTEAVKTAVSASEAFVKQRERLVGRREGHQYEATGNDVWRTVREGGHTFRVNLGGYVDTGLFLDHRITRARAAAEPAKTMLNLFAYTGSFSVYCAAAGMQTTTVDLSKTYLDWARTNLELNGLASEIVHSDVREFLETDRRWDLAVVDPPTFSNSKRMGYHWDVQRDHPALLDDVARVANVIWFSTNRQRFKFQWSRPGWEVRDETHATSAPDFDVRAHRAYRIARNA